MFKPLQQARPQLYRSRSGSPPLSSPSNMQNQVQYLDQQQNYITITPSNHSNKKTFYNNNYGNFSSYNDSKLRFTTTSSPKSPAANFGYSSKYSNATTATTTTATSKFFNKISTSPHSVKSALKNAQQLKNHQSQFSSNKLSKVITPDTSCNARQ